MGDLLSYEEWAGLHSREVEDLRRAIEHDRNVPHACDKIFNAVQSYLAEKQETATRIITKIANDIVSHEAMQLFKTRNNEAVKRGVKEAFSWAGNCNGLQEMANFNPELAAS